MSWAGRGTVPTMAGVAWTRGQGRFLVSAYPALSLRSMSRVPVVRSLVAGLLCALGALWIASPGTAAAACPPIQNKPGAIPHVQYDGVQHLTYCQTVSVKPGQNIIRVNGTNLFPSQPGYITRFDPELVYHGDPSHPAGTVPRVDVLHLHHAVWIVNGNPQFATGEEKTIIQAPKGFGWRSTPSDNWLLNDMIHDLVGTPATVDIVWRIDFVPDSAPAAASIHRVRTRWMDVSGPSPRVGISSPIYPVFNALRRMGTDGRYTFPASGPWPPRDWSMSRRRDASRRNATPLIDRDRLDVRDRPVWVQRTVRRRDDRWVEDERDRETA